MKIQGAGGHQLPFEGYFECSLSIPVTKSKEVTVPTPILVVPDTSYNKTVPLLIGTNVLNQLVNLPNALEFQAPVKIAVQSLTLGSKHLDKTDGVYDSVLAEEDLEIKPYTGILTSGRSTVVIPVCHNQIALIENDSGALPIVPGITEIKQGTNHIPFEIFNDSETTLYVHKGDHIGNIHQVSVQVQSSPENKDFLDSFDMSHLGDADSVELKSFLSKHRDVFAMNVGEMGCTSLTEHHIELEDPTPFKEKTRPIPPGMYDELKSYLAELLSAGVIEPSSSPFSSNIVLVRKKDKTIRICQDYRRLNLRTKRDSYDIPRVETLIECLKDAKYFACLDLICGYHQIPVAEEHRERTAFNTPCGFFQMRKMPMGLKNAGSDFQRTMDKALDGLNMKVCATYLDDVIVYSKTKDELYTNLELVFDAFRRANLRLKPKKCKFFQTKVEFLGHVMSSDGVQCSEKHIEDVLKWPAPSNVKELQTFLGLANFLRKFVPNFAMIVSPLTKLLKGHTTSKFRSKAKYKNVNSRNEAAPWIWGEDQENAFMLLKEKLTSPPCLAYPDFGKPFTLHTDASRNGLGCALYQADNKGKLHPISFGSRSLTPAERNYSTHKLEFLALKWAITVKFRYYLYNSKHPFDVYTDHNPLVYLTSTAKLDALSHRWLAELGNYDLEYITNQE